MKKVLWVVFLLLVGAGLFVLLGTDQVSDYWLNDIKEHASEHNAKKGDYWEAEEKYKVARYCQTLGNGGKAMVIYQDIMDNFYQTLPAQMAEFRLAQCFEGLINLVMAKEHYQNCYQKYPELSDNEWAHKSQIRFNEILANRI